MPKKGFAWERGAAITVVLVGGVLFAILFFRYILGILLPFLLGWGLAAALRPLAQRILKKGDRGVGILSLLLVLLAGGLLSFGFLVGVRQLWREALALLGELSGAGLESVKDQLVALFEKLPFFSNWLSDAESLVTSAFLSLAEWMLSALPQVLSRAFSALPELFFSVAVFCFSAFYFCMDYERLRRGLPGLFPKTWRVRLAPLGAGLFKTVWSYLRVYLLLFLCTFFILLFGFFLMQVPYAWLFALLVALFDLLPIIGVGTFLLPFAALRFLLGDPGMGVGLLLLYGCILVFRQIAEPKLLGKRLGLHPLAVLFAMYAGFKLLGLIGTLIAPPLAVLGYSLLAAGRAKESKSSTDVVEPLAPEA